MVSGCSNAHQVPRSLATFDQAAQDSACKAASKLASGLTYGAGFGINNLVIAPRTASQVARMLTLQGDSHGADD